ncbi:MAG: hypothetical protein ACR2F6_15505 [Mycobacteriales bacterium]
MISLDLAIRLKAAGVKWQPEPGDRFAIPGREMDDEVFVVSEMTVEVHRFESGTIIGFNGTTEWALDSVEQREAVWLPMESQLREALAGAFRRLEKGADGHEVTTCVNERERTSGHADAVEAYGLALLALIEE